MMCINTQKKGGENNLPPSHQTKALPRLCIHQMSSLISHASIAGVLTCSPFTIRLASSIISHTDI
ncbi:hypothetical protein EC970246_A0027 [Escherichia coli 97.0246]|uniref:Uncharacterized protein n=1 Tax=Escherichia coli 97.0246 TaxID=869670 RepID=A0A8E0FPC4_ECOLX|nr:hypothetical protein EC970246_A0027 [Escherichia coli 97.0246]